MDIKCGIYKILNLINQKIYIGQAININQRWGSYFRLECKKQPKIFYSLKKYGFDKHQFEIIEECSLEQLNEREIYWKQHYLDLLGWKNVLFCELYDTGGGPKSNETKKKMSLSRLGKKDSEKTIERRRISNLGKKRSNETKEKIKKSKQDNKPVLQFDLNNNLINEFDSIQEASLKTGFGKTNISANCNNVSKTCFGFIFKFKYHLPSKEVKIRKKKIMSLEAKQKIGNANRGNKFKLGKGRKILQFDKENNFIQEWNSMEEAGKILNINPKAIQNNCKELSKITKGYIFKYK